MTSSRAGSLAVAVLIAGAVAGCAPPPPAEMAIADLRAADLPPGARLRVAATTSIVADVVGEVGGDDIELLGLLRPGDDPHSFEPAPQALESLAQTEVLFVAGLGLELPLQQTLVRSGIAPPSVALSEGLPPTEDPHVWLDPRNVVHWAENAARALAALDPVRAEAYAHRAEAYRERVEAMDRGLLALVERLPADRRAFVSDHRALTHLAQRYGFEIIGSLIPAASSAAEPSARHLAGLLSAMEARGVTVIVVASPESRPLAERLAADVGGQVVGLIAESLGDAGGPADSYLGLMQYNLEAIVDALEP